MSIILLTVVNSSGNYYKKIIINYFPETSQNRDFSDRSIHSLYIFCIMLVENQQKNNTFFVYNRDFAQGYILLKSRVISCFSASPPENAVALPEAVPSMRAVR